MTDIVTLVRRAIAPLTRTSTFRRYAPRVLPMLETAMTFISRGRIQVAGLLVPALELRTVGARTGLTRRTRLMYVPDGPGRAIVAGTNFGRSNHPAWTANLRAHPDATIVVQGREIPVHAVEIPDAELDSIWERTERQWPGYRSYERASGRTVRMFRLATPWAPTGDAGPPSAG